MHSSQPVWLDRGVEFRRPVGRGYDTQFWLPFDYNERDAYYVASDGPGIAVRVRFMTGMELPPDGQARVQIFVDGVLARLGESGVASAAAPLDDGLGELTVTVAAGQFPRGRSRVHVRARYDFSTSGHPRVYDDYATFTVLRDTADAPAPPRVTPGFVPASHDPTAACASIFLPAGDGWVEVPSAGVLVEPAAPTRLRLRVQADTSARSSSQCGVMVDAIAVAVLLDGEMVETLGDARIVAHVERDRPQSVDFSLESAAGPGDHTLEFVYLPGLARPSRRVGTAAPSPWSASASTIATIRWHEGA
ncbi:MAG: hypothetical protein U0234_10970 [Sandaracinus sp.]